jgi:hypothetical protein
MSNSEKGPERRRYKRIKKHFILTYHNPKDPTQKFAASQLKNISMGGMCLITAREFEPMTRLMLDLKTPFLTELIHLEGVVLESREKIKNIIYETRLEFSELPDEAKFVLSKLIEHYEKEEERERKHE